MSPKVSTKQICWDDFLCLQNISRIRNKLCQSDAEKLVHFSWTTVIHHHHIVFMTNAAAGVLAGTAGLTCPQAAARDLSDQGNTDLQHGHPARTSSTDLQQCPAGLEARSHALTGFTALFKFYLSQFYAASLPDNDCIA